jgi:hypothetical protein
MSSSATATLGTWRPPSRSASEITLLALVDSTGLMEAGILDAHGNFLTAAALRPYIGTLQSMLAMVDALPVSDASG